MMKKVYIAGPDVFKPDAQTHFDTIRTMMRDVYGLEALVPYDLQLCTVAEIFQHNCKLIDQADAVLANINPFRGSEPDSGTCWEIGYAVAKEKPVVTYSRDADTVAKRTERYFRLGGTLPYMRKVWPDGMKAEDFDLPYNLMLMKSTTFVRGGIKEALDTLVLKLTNG